MKKTLLALAVSLAAISSGAHAAWDGGSLASPFVGNGETLLVIFDENVNHQVSYAQDLGATANFDLYHNNISNAAFSQSFTLDSTALSIFSTSNASDLRWAVVATHNGVAGMDVNGPASGVGFQVTTNLPPAVKPTTSDIGLITTTSGGILQNSVNGTDLNPATNVATTQSSTTSNYLGDPGYFGRQYKQTLLFDTTAAINETLGYLEIDRTGAGRTTNSSMTAFSGTWALDLTGKSLAYSTPVASTPVPAAMWLMGSALAGLGSIARRRRQQA